MGYYGGKVCQENILRKTKKYLIEHIHMANINIYKTYNPIPVSQDSEKNWTGGI